MSVNFKNPVVRPCKAADVETLAAMLPHLLAGNLQAVQALRSGDLLPAFRVMTIEVENKEVLAGFAEVQQILDEAHLLNLAIAPLWQGLGLGTVMLKQLLQAMQHSNCVRCLLEVRASNQQAIRLYERCGFTRDGVRKNYYPLVGGFADREDALLYSRSLESLRRDDDVTRR